MDIVERITLLAQETSERRNKRASSSELNDMLNAIHSAEEVVLLSGTEEQLDANEPRYRIEISGPERLLKPLADILHHGI